MFYPEIPPNGLSLSPPSTPTPPHGGRLSRCNSSFGWYDDVSAFESVDVPQSKAFQIEDWRNLETWDGGRETRESQEVRELLFGERRNNNVNVSSWHCGLEGC